MPCSSQLGNFTCSSSPPKPASAANFVERRRRRCLLVFAPHPQKECPIAACFPRHPIPNRVGSSAVKISSSIECLGRNPLRCNARIASKPPSTPTTPSYFPAFGMASMCEPVPTTRRVGIRTIPAREGIADGILADRESGFFAPRFHPRARLEIGRGENNSRHGGSFSFGESKPALRFREAADPGRS